MPDLDLGDHPEKVLVNRHGFSSKNLSVPENTFMVSAVYEDLKLRWSKRNIRSAIGGELCSILEDFNDFPWADIVVMVPGEADVECARVARLTGSAILTNDSDLLVYDLGPEGSVVILDSLDLIRSDVRRPRDAEIKALRLHPRLLSDRLGVANLTRFAFELTQSPQSSLAELVLRSKNRSAEAEEDRFYREFLEEYQAIRPAANGTRCGPQSAHILDARICELMEQYEPGPSRKGATLLMYLPILCEDHARRCAWEDGRRVRNLAYSILNLSRPPSARFEAVEEVIRRGRRLVSVRGSFMEEFDIASELSSIHESISSVKARTPCDTNTLSFWHVVALIRMYEHDGDGERSPTPSQIGSLLRTGCMGSHVTWADIHLTARIQSSLYSLRILKQILNCAKDIDDPSKKVLRILDDLPSLGVMMQSRRELVRDAPSQPSVNRLVSCFHSMPGGPDQEEHTYETGAQTSASTSLHSRSDPDAQQGSAKRKASSSTSRSRSRNMFNLLALD